MIRLTGVFFKCLLILRKMYVLINSSVPILHCKLTRQPTLSTMRNSAFSRFINENQITSQFLFEKELSLTTKGEDVIDILNNYLDKWKLSCVGIGTDGCPTMIGCNKGLVSFIKEQNENFIIIHCFLHRLDQISQPIQPIYYIDRIGC